MVILHRGATPANQRPVLDEGADGAGDVLLRERRRRRESGATDAGSRGYVEDFAAVDGSRRDENFAHSQHFPVVVEPVSGAPIRAPGFVAFVVVVGLQFLIIINIIIVVVVFSASLTPFPVVAPLSAPFVVVAVVVVVVVVVVPSGVGFGDLETLFLGVGSQIGHSQLRAFADV